MLAADESNRLFFHSMNGQKGLYMAIQGENEGIITNFAVFAVTEMKDS